MTKIIFNSRDEMSVVDIDKVAYVQANGNYSRITHIDNSMIMVSVGITQLEENIRKMIKKGPHDCFLRIGRSLIINQRYLSQINILKQTLVLTDYDKHRLILNGIPKKLLKALKAHIGETSIHLEDELTL